MERIEVITQVAADLWGRQPAAGAEPDRARRIDEWCSAHGFWVYAEPSGAAILGGAYSRLQLFAWHRPESGGIIWVRGDLAPEERAFAIAHELGHYALHRGEAINLHPACEPRDVDPQADPAGLRQEDRRVEEYTPRNRRELEANAFAAELLAPCETVRDLFTADSGIDAGALATRLGIASALSARRLVDAVLAPRRTRGARAQAASIGSAPAATTDPGALLGRLDDDQRAAARTDGPALVVAGPGTGKTATLVGRAAHLVLESGTPAERVLALTFSNRAAGEMRDRVISSGLPGGERMPIMTLHAFAASLLREYAPRVPHGPGEVPLTADFRILDETDQFLLMEELLGELPLRYYRSLGNPTRELPTLLADFSRARDALLTPAAYLALVELMAATAGEAPGAPYTEEHVAQARERAQAYGVWDRALRRRGLVDYGGLIQRAVELLRADADALADVRLRYPQVLVDEFQDTNHAQSELLFAVAGDAGSGLWVVGDRNQSIYRWRGASPANLPRLINRYPHLNVRTLGWCYRSVPDIVRLGSAMAARMAALAPGGVDGATHQASAALAESLRPLELRPVRESGADAAILREERYVNAAHERLGLTAAIQRRRAQGRRFAEQAVLCRTHKQVRQIAAVLASQGVPATQQGDFFARDEIKDALMLLSLAAGPDARGVLRAGPLLEGLGYPRPAPGELARAVIMLSRLRRQERPLPGALRHAAALAVIPGLARATRDGLFALGEVAIQVRNGPTVGLGLASYLLRPGGYAWRLARVADGRDQPMAGAAHLPGLASPARAQQALAALGELVRLAWRFDLRWRSEPDFRERLSRAVTHRGAATPDALEHVPGADVAADDVTVRTSATMAAMPTAPAVRCFLHQVKAMRAANAAVTVPPTEEDAVHLLTLHQSKGLEFPVVYLPGLAQGQFPQTNTNRDPIYPPGFRESDLPGEDDAEERCLFYVGVTRARDEVAITRAINYGHAAKPSVLLSLVEGFGDQPGDAALLPAGELIRLAAEAVDASSAQDDDAVEPADAPPVPGRGAPKPAFDLHELEQYLNCPLQYKYASIYGLLDPAENAVRRFYRYVRKGMHTLRDVRAAAPAVEWPAAEIHLRALWETHGPAGSAYDAFYWQAAQAILHAEWQAITAPDGAAATGRTRLAQPLRAELAHCFVDVTADREVHGALPGDPPDATLTVLVRLHTGRPRAAHKEDLALPLYYLAHQQKAPGAPLRIALAYAGAPLQSGGSAASGPPPGALDDVTEPARRDVEKYLKTDRKQRARLDKLDDAALGIAAGQFAPKPAEDRCAACDFCYVCPADSTEVVPTDTQLPTGAEPHT
jgi:DNA helicase II / ATP-dependent DNA helicase PcrA